MVYLPISSPQQGFVEAPVTSKNRHFLYLDTMYTFLRWALKQGKHFATVT